jgi:hypothetical protein
MAVRLTEVTADAVTGTVSCTWSCRCVDFASTAPRSHEDVRSSLPQPKLNPGASPLAGVAFSRMVASGTFPPVAQALTIHWAECPRSLLVCERATSTHRLTSAACGTVLTPLCELVLVAVGVAVAVGAGFAARVRVGTGVADAVSLEVAGGADDVALPEALRVRVADADGSAVAAVIDRDGVADGVLAGVVGGVTAGLEIGVLVGAGFAPEEVARDGAELAVVLDAVVAEGPVLVGVPEGDGLGDAAGSCTGSHDSLLGVVAAFATVMPAAARLTPEAAVSRTLPAISVTVAGRACAKRMKSPASAARYCRGTTLSVWSGLMRGYSSARRDTHLLDIKHRAER